MIEPGIYKHRNGGEYEVLMNGRNSNDCDQQMVVYKSLQDSDFPAGTIWIRTLKEFNTPGRFTKLDGYNALVKGAQTETERRAEL